jgi:hypothetical protein
MIFRRECCSIVSTNVIGLPAETCGFNCGGILEYGVWYHVGGCPCFRGTCCLQLSCFLLAWTGLHFFSLGSAFDWSVFLFPWPDPFTLRMQNTHILVMLASTQNIEAAGSSQTLVTTYITVRCCNPGDRKLNSSNILYEREV